MIHAIYFDQHVFRISVKLIEGGINGRVVGEAFELIDLRFQTVAPGLRMIHGINFSHNVLSFRTFLRINWYAHATL
jgi:hypothetical protein